MNTKRNPHIERYTRRHNAKMMNIYLHLAFFFAMVSLLSLFIFDDLLMTQAAKTENATWLTIEVQSQLKFAFRCISELFYILSLSSFSVTLFFMVSNYISQMKKRVKSKFTKIPN